MATPVASKSQAVKALRGPDKAAALLLCMGKPLAARLLKQFDTDELKRITRSIAELGTVPVPTLEALVEEFASQFANGVDLLGSPNEVEQMLDGVLPPEQIADVMSDVTGNSNHAMWDRLSNVPESVFAAISPRSIRKRRRSSHRRSAPPLPRRSSVNCRENFAMKSCGAC